jgi:effector-binding domain-containing protein
MQKIAVLIAFIIFSCTWAYAAEQPVVQGEAEGPAAHSEYKGVPPEGIAVELVVLEEPVQVAYLESKLGGDFQALFTSLVEAALKQDLFRGDTAIGLVFPFAMAKGWSEDTICYAAFSLPKGVEPAAPLKVYQIPAGEFLKTVHKGSYEESEQTWRALFEWAEGHGIKFSDGPAGEIYLNSPDQVPEEELLTEIYIPIAPGQAHPPGHPGHTGAEGRDGLPPAELEIKQVNIEGSLPVAYMAGAMGDDIFALFQSMIAEAGKQGLLNESTRVLSVYPEGMGGTWDETSPIYAAVNIPEAITPSGLLEVYEIPNGQYLMFKHIGPYERAGETFGVFMEWAYGHGVEFGEGPVFADYINDPESTPLEELATVIYVPVASGHVEQALQNEMNHSDSDIADHDEDHHNHHGRHGDDDNR